MKKKLLLGGVMLLLAFTLQPSLAQMNYWGLIPNKIDFTTATATRTTMTGAIAPASYQGYNAMWDNSGNLLFYIVGGVIYKPNNVQVGGVSYPIASYNSGGVPPKPVTLMPRQDAFHIVPAPGSSTRYYVFHAAYGGFSGVALVYTIVDCPTPGTVTVTNPANARLYDISIGNSSTIAITKPRIDNSRYLFFFAGGTSGTTTVDMIKYFVITSSGITVPTSNTVYTAPLNTSIMEAIDAEVYEDQDGYLLSWCSGSYEKFNCLKLSSTLVVSTTYNYLLPTGNKPANMEFSADGKYIYATAGGTNQGVYKTAITGTPTLIAGSSNYFSSQIELAKDGLFYLANTAGQLSTLNPTSNIFTISPLNVTLTAKYFVSSAGYISTLPEQLDQENYSCLTTQPCIPYGASINYVYNATQTCPSPYTMNSCAGISFNVSHSIAPAYYMFDMQSVDGSCSIALGIDKIHYNSGWVAGAPPTFYDLVNLADANGISLSTLAPGKVRITYSVKNSCGTVRSIVSNINVNNPKVGLTEFKINNAAVTSSCTIPYNLFSCTTPSLQILPVQKNTPAAYQLTIQAVDVNCNPLNGAGLITYNSAWINGGIPSNTELLTLADGNGVSLTGYNGLVLITYSVKDGCGTITSVNHKVRMNGAPVPVSTVLTLNSYTSSGIPVAAASTIPGVSMGIYSGGINLTSNAAFNSYGIMIDEVDCTTGLVIGNICNINTVLPNPITSLTSVNLNNLNVPAIPSKSWTGGMGFFANKGYGSCFIVNVTPINTCGSATVSSYVSSNCYCRMGSPEGVVVEEGKVAFYPTIFEEEIYADYILEGSENIVTVKIYNVSGNLIATPVENLTQNTGTNHLTVKAPGIIAGTYIVVLEANGVKHSQLMIKQ